MDEVEKTIQTVCDIFGITKDQLSSSSRKHPYPFARIATSVVLSRHFGLTTSKISSLMNRHHATVLYHFKIHEELMLYDKNYKKLFEKVSTSIKSANFIVKIRGDKENHYIKTSQELEQLLSNYMETHNQMTLRIKKH